MSQTQRVVAVLGGALIFTMAGSRLTAESPHAAQGDPLETSVLRLMPPPEERSATDAQTGFAAPGQIEAETVPAPSPLEEPISVIPDDFVPWWQDTALRPLRDPSAPLSVDVNSLVLDALRYASRVRAIGDNAVIAETAIVQAEAEFDVRAFMESRFVRTSIPTGNVLEAGFGVPRLREEDWHYSAGVRRKVQTGGQWEIAQRVGLRDSNSEFFSPPSQGNARLTLNYNQPLLNGAGKVYNTSLIVLADIDTRVAWDRVAAELQDHLLQVTAAFWRLYLERVTLLQRERHLERAEVILQRLEKRQDVDSLASQIARARAAVAMRRADLVRAAAAIRNGEALIRSLVNSPTMLAEPERELVTSQAPLRELVDVRLQDALVTAVQFRPEVDAALHEMRAAGVRLQMAESELLPILDLVLETYVSGLQGDSAIGESFADQFSIGEPSYTAGLVFDVPFGRRAALSRYNRRRAELRQLGNQFQTRIAALNAEVEVAVRDVTAAYGTLQGRYQAMLAAEADAQYLQRRWEMLPGEDQAASFLLEDLLDAQDRLALEEIEFSRTQVDYTLSLTRLNRATGTLLRQEGIRPYRLVHDCLPEIAFESDLRR